PLRGKAAHVQVRTTSLFVKVAERHGVSPIQVILAWLLTRSSRIVVLPGATRADHATQSARASDLELTDEDLAEIRLGFPV
ncbi:MAG: aldo/keto reductase, partial [Myxococcota bacterium]|nr:aldo/keto reductase [Myxococcota bacterium]